MRSSRNRNQGRLKQFRGRIGKRLIQKTEFKANSRRRTFNNTRPLNRNHSEAAPSTSSQNQQRHQRQRIFFQQRGIEYSESQNRRPVAGRNTQVRLFNSYAVEGHRVHGNSFQTAPVVRGRLKNNFGFMRSDTITRMQQLKRELQSLQQQQQQQQRSRTNQRWFQQSSKQLIAETPKKQTSSARTAIYEPSSTVTVQIPNVVNSGRSDVTVVFGKTRKKNKTNSFGRSISVFKPDGAPQETAVQLGSQSQISFEEDVNIDDSECRQRGAHGTSAVKDEDSFADLDVLVV